MSDDEKQNAGDAGDSGQASAYSPFVLMEELLDKLKLLNYENACCRPLGIKPFSRHDKRNMTLCRPATPSFTRRSTHVEVKDFCNAIHMIIPSGVTKHYSGATACPGHRNS